MTRTTLNILSGQFSQMGYVTSDIDEAIGTFAELGVRHFTRSSEARFEVGHGREAVCDVALANTGGLQIELIHPIEGAVEVYRQILDGNGFELRFHHQCHWVDNESEFQAIREDLRGAGHPIVIDGAGHGSRYFYADLRPLIGHHVEYVWFEAGVLEQLQASIPEN